MNKIIQIKEVGREKTARLPIKIIQTDRIKKPSWIKMKLPESKKFHEVKSLLKKINLLQFAKKLVALISVNATVRVLLHL